MKTLNGLMAWDYLTLIGYTIRCQVGMKRNVRIWMLKGSHVRKFAITRTEIGLYRPAQTLVLTCVN